MENVIAVVGDHFGEDVGDVRPFCSKVRTLFERRLSEHGAWRKPDSAISDAGRNPAGLPRHALEPDPRAASIETTDVRSGREMAGCRQCRDFEYRSGSATLWVHDNCAWWLPARPPAPSVV